MPKRKRHPMVMSKAGDLFAVQIAPDTWGYCRAWDGIGIEVPPVFTRASGMPDYSNWAPLEPPTIVAVGKVPFDDEEDATMPLTWGGIRPVEPRYTIEERGIYRHTSDPADLQGTANQITLTAATLGAFLRQQYEGGALREVGARPSNGVDKPTEKLVGRSHTDHPAFETQDEVQPPLMIFVKIVQAIGGSGARGSWLVRLRYPPLIYWCDHEKKVD